MSLRPGTEEWKEARYRCVTATDLGKIMGVDPSTSRVKLMKMKVLRRDAMDEANDYGRNLMMMGRTFESVARKTYESEYLDEEDKQGYTPDFLYDSRYRFLGGSPDYYLPDERLVVEFKTHFHPNLHDAQPIQSVLDIPLKYYLQVQAYLRIMDVQRGQLMSWTISRGHTLFEIKRDEELFLNTILPVVRNFYQSMVEIREAPESVNANKIYLSLRQKSREKTVLLDRITDSLRENTCLLCRGSAQLALFH